MLVREGFIEEVTFGDRNEMDIWGKKIQVKASANTKTKRKEGICVQDNSRLEKMQKVGEL